MSITLNAPVAGTGEVLVDGVVKLTLNAAGLAGVGTNLTALNGTAISSGTVAAARIDSAIARTTQWTTKTTTYTAVAGDSLMCNTTSAAFTVTLPAAPAANDLVRIADYAGTFTTNNLTIGRNALNIMGLAEDMVISTNNVSLTLQYIDVTEGWRIV